MEDFYIVRDLNLVMLTTIKETRHCIHIDLVCVNLYAFEKAVLKAGKDLRRYD